MIVYLDTNIVIYAVENPPIWGLRALTHLTSLRSATADLMVSDLTRMESLVGPFKSGNKAVENDYRSFFGASDVHVVAINAAVCERAADIRAKFNFRPMDSLHLAAAIIHGAAVFLTNDIRLSTFTDVKIEVL